MSSRIRSLILAFSAAGLALALEASWVHYRLLTDPSYVSPCNITSGLSCSQLYLTHGRIAGIPVAFGGLVWFTLVGLIAAFAAPGQKPTRAASYLRILAGIGLVVVPWLAYTSFVVAKAACIFCIGTYVCVVAIFVLARQTVPAPLSTLPGQLVADLRGVIARPAAFVASLICAVGFVAFLVWFPAEGAMAHAAPSAPSKEAASTFADAWVRQPRIDLGVPADGAKVVIVKFNDFECPMCRQVEDWYRPVLEKFDRSNPGAVKYVMKDWPWSAACNFATPGIPGHEASCNAAAAVRIARDRGKTDEIVTWLFAHQGTTPAAVAEATTRILGLGPGEFEKAYQLQLAGIRQDVADGQMLRITGTPTFFINGVRLPASPIPAAYFEMAISLELAKAGDGDPK
jgi:uncharacterized membrane protein/protein-disulfide isomerase